MTALPANTQMSLQDFLAVRDFIYGRTGIFFNESKQYFLENRLNRRIQDLNLSSYREYLAHLQGLGGKDELTQLFNEITTNETSFWRNPPQIEAFQKNILHEAVALAKARGSSRLRIWSAACSSGEEPYTLAMICAEARDGLMRGMQAEIVATDISERVLALAREGVYGSYTLRNLTPAQVKGHFIQQGPDAFKVRPELQQMVSFRNFNLVDYPGYRMLGSFDVIFCRNVLIYFDEAVKIKVIKGFHESLQPKAFLLVGHSESIHSFNVGFELLHFSKAMGYRKR
ncbi:CheR family methyltransferase [Mesoterricola sediminis]|uniref:protein-glutamate O-methyltransferase n=1 Tax=Mesoterricola sediminis TaxID=2927980 RepID=A0AA48H8E0_9BACT|nr:protein-glutamate O-methyltransferase CheR [Mesoterricola sediminis]BDU77833.1 chemotaxis protein methyltransferase [Mesoterricola sediminis]